MRFEITIAAMAAFAAISASAESIYDIAKSNPDFSALVVAVDAAKLDAVLSGPGDFTVFAPPNSGFEKLDEEDIMKLLDKEWFFHLQDLLKYHTLGSRVYAKNLTDGQTAETLNGEDITITLPPGQPPKINGESKITTTDIEADNGVIHVIDTVLLPTSATKTIVDIAVDNSDFSTLVELVLAAGLAGDLSGDGPLTVFAPPNDAFDELPAGTVEALKKPENKDTLVDILTYHVIGANVASSDLTDGPVPTLLEGSTVNVKVEPPMVDDAGIVAADILASNGFIHVIDSVLLPCPESGTRWDRSYQRCVETMCGACPNTCAAGSENHLGHCTDKTKFLQCDNFGGCFERECPSGTVWSDTLNTCDRP